MSVRAADPRRSRWQDRLERPWGWFGQGYHPNRDTVGAIAAAGLGIREVEAFEFQAAPRLVRPHVIGVAERRLGVHEREGGTTGNVGSKPLPEERSV